MAPTVRAAGPALAFSPNSGQGALGDVGTGSGNTATTATLVTVTGTGFPAGQDNIAVGFITLGSSVTAANFNQLQLIRPSLLSGTTTAGDAMADANGWFTAQFYVPEVQSGAYSFVASYIPTGGSTTLTTVTSFTINPAVQVLTQTAATSTGVFGQPVEFYVSGFQASETVSFAPTTVFDTTRFAGDGFSSFNVGTNGATCAYAGGSYASDTTYQQSGRCSGGAQTLAFVAQRKGGAFTISATGGTSSISASASFTDTASIAILNGAVTTLSIPTAAGSATIEGFNFPASATIAANSLTITVGNTVANTIHNSISTNSKGNFPVTTFTWTQALPEGLATVGLNGTNYNWANANIQPPPVIGAVMFTDDGIWQGPLIASSSTGPAFIVTDASTYNLSTEPFMFGIGFGASAAISGVTYTPTSSGPSPFSIDSGSDVLTTTSAEGAFMATPAGGTDFPYSYGSSNTLSATATRTGTTTITITPNISTPSSTSFTLSSGQSGATPFNRQGRATSNTARLEVKGFSESTFLTPDTAFTVTLTSSSGVVSTWATVSTNAGTCATTSTPPAAAGSFCVASAGRPGDYLLNAGAVPELAGGSYTVTVTGTSTGNIATRGTSITPVVIGSALSVATGTPGTTVAFSTSTTSGGVGVHGLNPSTAYSLMFDGPSGTSVGTFTSTANGEVPPGTQFTLPSGATGTHVVDIVASGSTSSAIFGKIAPEQQGSAQYTGVASAPVTDATASNVGTGQGLTIGLIGAGTLSPNVGTPGTVVTVSASGLSPSTAYYVVLYNDISYASFTSTATGTVPAGVTFTFPNIPVASGKESGDAFGVRLSSTALHTGTGVAANATFILQSALKLSANSAAAGQTLSVTAGALAAGAAYSIIFNYQVNPTGTTFTGTTVGSLVGGTDGSATGQFTVPANAAAGSYSIQLARISPTVSALGVLAVAPLLTVGAPSGVGTSTLTASGTATEAAVSGQATVSQSFTNTASTSLSVYMWVSVKNSAGQTVGVFLGSATIAAGGTTSIGAALFNLPSGTYTATVFCTTTSGIVVSQTSTTSSFSV